MSLLFDHRKSTMASFGLFGDSYIKRLDNFFGGDLLIPGSSTFVHQGGLRFDRLDDMHKMKKTLKKARPDYVFLSIGGNDISPISKPDDIFDNICDLVTEFEEAGVRRVFISEILQRGDFSKSQPPGLTKSKFDRDRKRINKLLSEKYSTNLIKFPDIRCPRDYDKDKVHLSYPTRDVKTCGIRKYFFRLRLVFCSL